MLTPPLTNSDHARGHLDRRQGRQPEHIHRQPRRHEAFGSVALLDHRGEQPDDDAAVQRFRVPRPARGIGGNEGVAVFGEEGLICHGLQP
jgi:hypothetical protein